MIAGWADALLRLQGQAPPVFPPVHLAVQCWSDRVGLVVRLPVLCRFCVLVSLPGPVLLCANSLPVQCGPSASKAPCVPAQLCLLAGLLVQHPSSTCTGLKSLVANGYWVGPYHT
jgi:hypothetical protein